MTYNVYHVFYNFLIKIIPMHFVFSLVVYMFSQLGF